jgi:hypothetical protein
VNHSAEAVAPAGLQAQCVRFTPWKVPREAPSCGDTVSTAKTTLLPANDSLGIKKDLHSNTRLDDSLGQAFTFRALNERRLLSAEADQALTSQECQERPFLNSGSDLRMSKAGLIQEFQRQAGAVSVATYVGLVLDFGTGEYAADNMTKGQFRVAGHGARASDGYTDAYPAAPR